MFQYDSQTRFSPLGNALWFGILAKLNEEDCDFRFDFFFLMVHFVVPSDVCFLYGLGHWTVVV